MISKSRFGNFPFREGDITEVSFTSKKTKAVIFHFVDYFMVFDAKDVFHIGIDSTDSYWSIISILKDGDFILASSNDSKITTVNTSHEKSKLIKNIVI